MEQVAARQSLDEVREQLDVVRAAAQSELANAREAQRAAEYKWTVQQQGNRASDDTIKAARARLVVAQETMEHLKDVYDHTPGRSSEDAGKAEALSAYLGAQANRDSAQRALNWYVGKPTAIQQAMLDADVAVAKARVAAAERALQDLQQGPDPDTLAQAEARLRYAEAQVAAAQAALADSELRAPFGGTVAAVLTREREWISTGQAILSLADLAHLQVETTDLNEIDAARVEVGAPVSVTFDALPEVEVAGHVVQVAPKASAGSGVNYTVTVELAETPARLRWGMTAFVDIEVGGG
jgi:multidrug resistance efflux pump